MALDDILRAIRQETEEELGRIGAEAFEEVTAIDAAARTEAERARAQILDCRVRDLAAERDRVLRAARRAARGAWRDGREEVFQGARRIAAERLATLRDDPCYPGVLRALLAEAVIALPGATVVRADPRDAALLVGAGVRRGREVELSLETWGGVEVISGDGRTVRNTVEERLARAEAHLRPLVAGVISGMAPTAEGAA